VVRVAVAQGFAGAETGLTSGLPRVMQRLCGPWVALAAGYVVVQWGAPFASPNALFDLSKLSVWWLRLGMKI
jgi:hypothetical protein